MNLPVSICIIGKNEENCIERCLQALIPYKLPIVYTDTGSSDRTVSIASRYTELIYRFDWCNDFSKARNYCAAKAPTDWVWVVDCDEYLLEADMEELISFCQKPENTPFIGTIRQRDAFTLSGSNEQTAAITRLGRIYNRKYYRYDGAVHEQLVPVSAKGVTYHNFSILFEHDGYVTPEILEKKCRRNIRLMLSSLEEKEDPYLYYQLGKAYSSIGKKQEAASAFGKGLSFDLDPGLFYVQSMVESYGYCLLDLKEYETALSFENIYDTFAISADFVFLMGLIYMNNARFEQAVEQFEKAATFSTCVVEGVNTYRAFYNIGVIRECLGQIPEAVAAYEKCNDYKPARDRLEVLSLG